MNDDKCLAELKEMVGETIVLDGVSPYVYIGKLIGATDTFVFLEDADAHDLRDSATTREIYVIEAKRYGVRRNRRSLMVRWDQVASLSLLEGVVEH